MSLRVWAVKPGELRALSREELLLFAARCCLRARPWVPKELAPLWKTHLLQLLDLSSRPVLQVTFMQLRDLTRTLSDGGSTACNRLDGTPDEALGRCYGYAVEALTTAIDACAAGDRRRLVAQVIDVAKFAASIPAVWAHDGKVKVKGNPVEVACTSVWAATRRDLEQVVGASLAAVPVSRRVIALEKLGPLWKGKTPAWFSPR